MRCIQANLVNEITKIVLTLWETNFSTTYILIHLLMMFGPVPNRFLKGRQTWERGFSGWTYFSFKHLRWKTSCFCSLSKTKTIGPFSTRGNCSGGLSNPPPGKHKWMCFPIMHDSETHHKELFQVWIIVYCFSGNFCVSRQLSPILLCLMGQ